LQFLAANFQKCDRKQLDLKECVLKAAQNGIPQLTRALEVAEATIGAGTGSVAVEQKLKQCKLDGFHEMKVDKFE
jgi:hypothetical protein